MKKLRIKICGILIAALCLTGTLFTGAVWADVTEQNSTKENEAASASNADYTDPDKATPSENSGNEETSEEGEIINDIDTASISQLDSGAMLLTGTPPEDTGEGFLLGDPAPGVAYTISIYSHDAEIWPPYIETEFVYDEGKGLATPSHAPYTLKAYKLKNSSGS